MRQYGSTYKIANKYWSIASQDLPPKLASFKADQRPYRSSAANHVGAAVFAQMARSGRLDAAHR